MEGQEERAQSQGAAGGERPAQDEGHRTRGGETGTWTREEAGPSRRLPWPLAVIEIARVPIWSLGRAKGGGSCCSPPQAEACRDDWSPGPGWGQLRAQGCCVGGSVMRGPER